MDRVNISFCFNYVIAVFKIPIVQTLRANVHPTRIHVLHRFKLPQVWIDIFSIWFQHNFIPPQCTDINKHSNLLNSLLCFCTPVSKTIRKYAIGDLANEVTFYEVLAENGIYTWAQFLLSFDVLASQTINVYFALPLIIVMIKLNIPEQWKQIIGDLNVDNHNVRMHRVDFLMDNGIPTKSNYLWLLPFYSKINNKAMTDWTVELNITGIPDNWGNICRKIMRIRNPILQDFARSFLHRSYQLNPVIAKYRPDVTELCTFCN